VDVHYDTKKPHEHKTGVYHFWTISEGPAAFPGFIFFMASWTMFSLIHGPSAAATSNLGD